MKAWALINFIHFGGEYKAGDPLELPRNTDEEKAEFERLRNRGYITTKPTGVEKDAEATAVELEAREEELDSRRTGRGPRTGN